MIYLIIPVEYSASKEQFPVVVAFRDGYFIVELNQWAYILSFWAIPLQNHWKPVVNTNLICP